MTAGCLLGLLLLKLFDCRRVLIAFSVAAFVCLTAALTGGASVAIVAFKVFGFCLSVMWSIIFSLALNSLAEHHGTFSGILCTGIIGGAFVPLAVGQIGNVLGLRTGLLLVYLTLGYILSIGFWATPLVDNATVSVRELARAIPKALRSARRG
jgi:fucose permease